MSDWPQLRRPAFIPTTTTEISSGTVGKDVEDDIYLINIERDIIVVSKSYSVTVEEGSYSLYYGATTTTKISSGTVGKDAEDNTYQTRVEREIIVVGKSYSVTSEDGSHSLDDSSTAITTQTAKQQSKEEIDDPQLQRHVGWPETGTEISSGTAYEGAEDDADGTEIRFRMVLPKAIASF